MAETEPVFYDCEASGLDGYPIEIGWAFIDPGTGTIVSESHLIRPPEEWPVEENWDQTAESLHGIALAQLKLQGRPAWDVARRMNEVLDGRELFSDSLQDEAWLRLLFDAAGLDPFFTVRRTSADILISQAAAGRGMDRATYASTEALAAEQAPRRHRAEADARHLAFFWHNVTHHQK